MIATHEALPLDPAHKPSLYSGAAELNALYAQTCGLRVLGGRMVIRRNINPDACNITSLFEGGGLQDPIAELDDGRWLCRRSDGAIVLVHPSNLDDALVVAPNCHDFLERVLNVTEGEPFWFDEETFEPISTPRSSDGMD